MTLDAASLQVLISRLTSVADEMGAVLRRAAYSPNIKERADCSAALFTASGELLVQAEHIPVHLGSMPASVAAAIRSSHGGRVQHGDHILLNDPYEGGTHLNDLTLVSPCFVDGALFGWAATRAHHADVGGMVPGSIPPEADEIQQEGFRIPPVLLDDDIVRLLCANSRTPQERIGDLEAQVGANTVGVERLAAFASQPVDEVIAYGERRMRAAIGEMPDGSWRFEDVLDSDPPCVIRLALTIRGDEMTFDFSDSDDQQRGNVNAVEAVTRSAVAWAVRAAADPTVPANGGALRPVEVITRSGSVVAAAPPAAVGAGNVEVSQRVADVCLGALALAVPERIGAASQGTMNNVMIGGRSFVYYETIGGGQGGRPNGVAGMSGVHTAMTNTKNTPVEALEREFPMRVLRYRLRQRSGGDGHARGGEGIERDVLMLEDATVSLVTERRVSRPWGAAGGEPGAVGENWLLRAGDETRAERLPARCTVDLRRGDVLRMLTPGGGGWGQPAELAVRPMTLHDIERVQSVAVAAGEMFRSVADERVSKCADHPPMPAGALQAFVDTGRAWVATADGDVVGFLSARIVDGCVHIEEMSVDSGFGRRGLASSLLETVAEWAGEQGYPAVTLTTFREVPWNRPFYERRGFRVVEGDELSPAFDALLDEEDHEYGLVRELRVVMRRDLHPSATVRSATLSDLGAIARLFNALIPTTTVGYRDDIADEEEMNAWWATQEEQQNPVLVAEIEGEVVGYVTWGWFRGWTRFPGYRHTRELTIHIDEPHHGKGIGRVLMDALVERARASGIHVLVSAIDAANEGSIEFHRRLGFDEVGRMPQVGRKFDRWLDLVLMQRVVSAP